MSQYQNLQPISSNTKNLVDWSASSLISEYDPTNTHSCWLTLLIIADKSGVERIPRIEVKRSMRLGLDDS